MLDPEEKLTPADPEDLASAIAFVLKFEGRKRWHDADELMAKTASWSGRPVVRCAPAKPVARIARAAGRSVRRLVHESFDPSRYTSLPRFTVIRLSARARALVGASSTPATDTVMPAIPPADPSAPATPVPIVALPIVAMPVVAMPLDILD
jgi:hypothetical protein